MGSSESYMKSRDPDAMNQVRHSKGARGQGRRLDEFQRLELQHKQQRNPVRAGNNELSRRLGRPVLRDKTNTNVQNNSNVLWDKTNMLEKPNKQVKANVQNNTNVLWDKINVQNKTSIQNSTNVLRDNTNMLEKANKQVNIDKQDKTDVLWDKTNIQNNKNVLWDKTTMLPEKTDRQDKTNILQNKTNIQHKTDVLQDKTMVLQNRTNVQGKTTVPQNKTIAQGETNVLQDKTNALRDKSDKQNSLQEMIQNKTNVQGKTNKHISSLSRTILQDKTNVLPSRISKPPHNGRFPSNRRSNDKAFERTDKTSSTFESSRGTPMSSRTKTYLKNNIMAMHRGRSQLGRENETKHTQRPESSQTTEGLKLTALSAVVKKSRPHNLLSDHASTEPSTQAPCSLPLTKSVSYKDGYNLITEDILHRIPYVCVDGPRSMSEQASIHIRNLVEWYKVNKFSYVVPRPDLDSLILKVHQRLHSLDVAHSNMQSGTTVLDTSYQNSSMLSTLTRQRPNITEHNAHKYSHIVQRATKIGKFLISVTIVDIKSNHTSTALLASTDARVEVLSNDLLSLRKDACSIQVINSRPMPVYMTWFVYKKNPLDVDFFK